MKSLTLTTLFILTCTCSVMAQSDYKSSKTITDLGTIKTYANLGFQPVISALISYRYNPALFKSECTEIAKFYHRSNGYYGKGIIQNTRVELEAGVWTAWNVRACMVIRVRSAIETLYHTQLSASDKALLDAELEKIENRKYPLPKYYNKDVERLFPGVRQNMTRKELKGFFWLVDLL